MFKPINFKVSKITILFILLIVFTEILILLPRPPTAIAYGIPPTSGQIPWKSVGLANQTLEKTRDSLDFIRKTQQKAYLYLKLQILGLDETNFVIESNFHNLAVRKILFRDLQNTTKNLGGNALGSVEAIEKGFLIVTRDGKVNLFDEKNRSLFLLGVLDGIEGDKRNIQGLRDSIVVSEDKSKINLASSYSFISEINGKLCF